MEIETMYTEVVTEDGVVLRIIYRLQETRSRGERAYGLSCAVAGGGSAREVPEVFFDLAVAQSVLCRVAAAGVMPVHIEDVVYELMY